MSDDLVAVDSATIWPADAMDVEEAVLANWFARPGQRVDEGQTVCEIQIEKVSVDVPAPVDGQLVECVVTENEEFTRGETLARIEPT